MYTKLFLKYQIREAYDLTESEKMKALKGIDMLFDANLIKEGSVEDDIANYYKQRNKLRKVGLRKGVKNPGAAKAKVAVKTAAKGAAKKKSFGSKIASKLLAYAKKKGLLAKAAKVGKVAAKTI